MEAMCGKERTRSCSRSSASARLTSRFLTPSNKTSSPSSRLSKSDGAPASHPHRTPRRTCLLLSCNVFVFVFGFVASSRCRVPLALRSGFLDSCLLDVSTARKSLTSRIPHPSFPPGSVVADWGGKSGVMLHILE
eukprot:1888102-Rhodomonas_salina.2